MLFTGIFFHPFHFLHFILFCLLLPALFRRLLQPIIHACVAPRKYWFSPNRFEQFLLYSNDLHYKWNIEENIYIQKIVLRLTSNLLSIVSHPALHWIRVYYTRMYKSSINLSSWTQCTRNGIIFYIYKSNIQVRDGNHRNLWSESC